MAAIDIEAERQVIGRAVASEDGRRRSAELATVDDFRVPAHARLLEAAALLVDIHPGSGRPTTVDNVQWHASSRRIWGLPQTARIRAAAAADLADVDPAIVLELVEERCACVDRYAKRVAMAGRRWRAAHALEEARAALENGADVDGTVASVVRAAS